MNFAFLKSTVESLENKGLRRRRYSLTSNFDAVIEHDGRGFINFSSNDYLGLSQNHQVLQSYVEGLSLYGASASASPVVTGYSVEHEKLEAKLAEKLNKAAVLLFTSGFSANQALCHAMFGHKKSGNILCDKYMHASFIQASQEVAVSCKRFRHNDVEHTKLLLNKMSTEGTLENSALVTEGVFSMDGDLAPLNDFNTLLNQYAPKPWLVVDDAHGFGVLGESGFGSCDLPELKGAGIDVLMGTFGKAIGTAGAFIAGPKELIDYIESTSKHYIYSTSFSAAQARASLTSLELVEKGQFRARLFENINLFKELSQQHGIVLSDSSSPIQHILVGDPIKVMQMSRALRDLGIWINGIRTPTVPPNTDRLRITISALHQSRDIESLCDALSMVVDKFLKN